MQSQWPRQEMELSHPQWHGPSSLRTPLQEPKQQQQQSPPKGDVSQKPLKSKLRQQKKLTVLGGICVRCGVWMKPQPQPQPPGFRQRGIAAAFAGD